MASSSSLSSGSTSASGSVTTLPTPVTPLEPDTLHAAQLRKIAHIVKKARILPGHRVLDLGCGWGAVTLHIARTIPDTHVDAITLSTHQHAHVQAAGLEGCVRVQELKNDVAGRFHPCSSVTTGWIGTNYDAVPERSSFKPSSKK
ncbi:hypothetical protein FA95DRAFT_1608793 [Auriscalpium vulgare]|uniref:Uncharacterized protein n=1 Tax=Auriscalpium vulgare TaxID=40419 RepID=A0ACB8RJ70_9AGAM|nr:hypothetical protein FA95DRAFT_1608793 [Auriscalpium vulgare]